MKRPSNRTETILDNITLQKKNHYLLLFNVKVVIKSNYKAKKLTSHAELAHG